MENLKKVSIKDYFSQVKNMAMNPKGALDVMGEDAQYQSIALPQLFISMALVPIAMLIAMVLGSEIPLKYVIKLWLMLAGAMMFYYILISWGLSKVLWMLKDSMGFDGTQEKFNKIVVLSLSSFFIGNSIYWLLTFIDALGDIATYLAPLVGAGAAGYVLFQGFHSGFEVAEEKKPVFVGIMVAVPVIAFILFHMVILGNKGGF